MKRAAVTTVSETILACAATPALGDDAEIGSSSAPQRDVGEGCLILCA